MGVPAGYYDKLLGSLRAEGMLVAVLPCESHSTDASRSPRITGYAEFIEERIPEAYDELQREAPYATIACIGHSLGGQLGLVSASRYFPDTPFVLVASGTAYYRSFRRPRRWIYLAGSQTISLVARLWGRWPGDVLRFGGVQSAPLMHDWAANVRTGFYRSSHATFDYEESLRAFRGRTLTIHITADRLAPVDATRRLLGKTPQINASSITYRADRGTSRPGSHFTWARDVPGLGKDIATWIRQTPHDR